MQNTNQQRGSAMIFTAIGVVLAVVALGLLYSTRSRQDSAVVPVEDAVQTPVAQQQSEEDTKQDQKPAAEDSKPSQTDQNQSGQSSTNTNQNSSTNTTPNGGNSTTQRGTAPGSSTAPTNNSNLPTTGPTEDAISILVSGIVTGTAVTYIRSRKLV